ncbi:MAG: 4,5-DOPA dioxygenase extradiol [Legionella sp.]|nr:4,5-DOPA dioxygenase extradiol [Legionella sp.]
MKTGLMPVIFLGHGSPMNAIETNDFTNTLSQLGEKIPTPTAILCISAHWLTEGTWVTHMPHPRTIHDFYGFPKELSRIQYPAVGSPMLAELIKITTQKTKINLDNDIWGLDHGTWSVLRHIYPEANIPIVQLSIYLEQPASYHYQIGTQLKILRQRGILIVGSGNIVHNLQKIIWGVQPKPYDWAIEFDDWVKNKLIARDFNALTSHYLDSESGQLSVPIPDHYFPLLYVLGASDEHDKLHFEYEEIQNGSISMRSLSYGLS